jgi:hypothetical protein
MEIRSLVSGMPHAEREKARLAVFQAWFDDSGKEGKAQSPVYLLAGYSARVKVWEDFADEWQDELNQSPKLRWLHATEAYGLKGEFGFDKDTQTASEWTRVHGRGNKGARDERLLKFAKIIVKHLRPNDESHGVTWAVSHTEYDDFLTRLTSSSTATIKDIEEIQRYAKYPFYLSFQKILGQELKLRVAKALATNTTEKTEVLFDEGIDDPARLEEGFKAFMEAVRLDDPRYLNFFQNTKPEYRNDECNPPLQAADLLAWHLRRMCLEISRGATKYDDPVWNELRRDLIDPNDPAAVKYWDYRYEAEDWERILKRILTRRRINTLLDMGIALPTSVMRGL